MPSEDKSPLIRTLTQAQAEASETFDGPSVAVSPDIRRLAGVAPALVVDIRIPASSASFAVLGEFQLTVAQELRVVEPVRSEYWVLGSGPRRAVVLEGVASFEPRSDSNLTLYKLYFALPEAGTWKFELPAVSSQTQELPPRAIFGRSEGGRALLQSEA